MPESITAAGVALTVMSMVRAVLVPHAFVAVTFSLPDVAVAPKVTVMLLPEPVIVAPVPMV